MAKLDCEETTRAMIRTEQKKQNKEEPTSTSVRSALSSVVAPDGTWKNNHKKLVLWLLPIMKDNNAKANIGLHPSLDVKTFD